MLLIRWWLQVLLMAVAAIVLSCFKHLSVTSLRAHKIAHRIRMIANTPVPPAGFWRWAVNGITFAELFLYLWITVIVVRAAASNLFVRFVRGGKEPRRYWLPVQLYCCGWLCALFFKTATHAAMTPSGHPVCVGHDSR